MLVVMLGVAAYAVYFFTRRYPQQSAAWTKRQSTRGGKTTARARTAPAPSARQGAAPPAPDAGGPTRPAGSPGNPRGTSPRGERRRTKRKPAGRRPGHKHRKNLTGFCGALSAYSLLLGPWDPNYMLDRTPLLQRS